MNTSDIAAFLIPLGVGITVAIMVMYSRKTRKQREAALINRIRQTGEEELEKVRMLQVQTKVKHEAQMARMRSQHEEIKKRHEAFLEEVQTLSARAPKPPGEE